MLDDRASGQPKPATASRRGFLRLAVGLGAASLAAACTPSPSANPGPTVATRPSASAPIPAAPSAASPAPSAAAASPVAQAAPGAPSGATTTVRAGSIFGLLDAPVFLAIERGYFTQAGLTVDVQQFNTIANMIPLLGTGQLDVAFDGASSAGFFNALNRGIPISMVANQGVADGSHTTPYYAVVASKELMTSGKIKSVADLKGLPVNVLSTGTLAELEVAEALKTAGLTLKDVQVQQLAFPDAVAALKNGAVAASFLVEPFVTLGVQGGVAQVLVNVEKLNPGREITDVFYSQAFSRKTDAANRFMLGYLRGVRDYLDIFISHRGDKATAVNQLIKHLAVKQAPLYNLMGMPNINPNGTINVADVKAQQQWYVSEGQVQKAANVDNAVNASFAQAAVKQLGPYQP